MEEWKEISFSEDDEWRVILKDYGVVSIQYRKRQPTQEELVTDCVNRILPESVCYSTRQILIREIMANTQPPEAK